MTTILAVSLLLLVLMPPPPSLALVSLAVGNPRREEPSTTWNGGSIVGMELQPLVISARRSLLSSTPSHPDNPGDGPRNPPVSPARDRAGTAG